MPASGIDGDVPSRMEPLYSGTPEQRGSAYSSPALFERIAISSGTVRYAGRDNILSLRAEERTSTGGNRLPCRSRHLDRTGRKLRLHRDPVLFPAEVARNN